MQCAAMEVNGTNKKRMKAKRSTDKIKIKCYSKFKGRLHNNV